MKILISFIVMLSIISVHAEKLPEVTNPGGFVTLGWFFDKSKEDLYDRVQSLNSNLKGSVNEFLDWENVSKIIAIYNYWHLPGLRDDIRIRHIEDNLNKASFGDRFKGANPGGSYIFLLQYRNKDREVLLSFKDGIFLIEGKEGIGVVDIRNTH
ncbi:MAG: hypothetical protein A2017_13555 [Lentisphaerae bacterium GWF2_44_16]|nr:MAG: hypothetical protein A2017_13555 [Lentisphaerae bacterium GWF2_44_16]